MAIRATCEGCFMEYKVPDDRAGKAFKCKECGGAVRVPRAGQQSASPPAASPPPKQRKSAGSKRPSSKKRKKPSSSAGTWIGVGVAVMAVVGLGAYFMKPGAENEQAAGDADGGDPAGATGGDGATTASTTAPPLTADEEAILADYRGMFREFSKMTAQERTKAREQFAADHNISVQQLLDISKKERAAREAANKVVAKWKPLGIKPLASSPSPKQAELSVPVTYSGAVFSTPKLQSPFVLSATTVTGGVERHVFNLSSSQPIGSWLSKTVASSHEQVSPDGRFVCLVEGVKPPITLHIVDAATGETVQQLTSPDLHRVAHLAFIGPKRLMVLTPRTAERTRDKTRRGLIFDATTGKEVSRFEQELNFSGNEKASISPDGRYLAAAGKGKSLEVLEIATGDQICAVDLADAGVEHGQIHSVSISPDGGRIAVLEQRPLVALRLHLIDSATGDVANPIDLYGAINSLGAPLEMQLKDPLVWFPDGRYLLIGKLAAVDTVTGRRVWQAQGKQTGNNTARLPIAGGLLYQVNTGETSSLATLPIDFDRIASTQAAWPTDAALNPGMSVAVAVDLAAGGLAEVHDFVKTGLEAKLTRLGFDVADTADRMLFVGLQEGAVLFRWTAGADVLWESVAASDSAMLAQLGHLKGQTAERAATKEGVVKVQAYPVPYFISGDRQWTLPVVDQIVHDP